jgi:hypothetical protein
LWERFLIGGYPMPKCVRMCVCVGWRLAVAPDFLDPADYEDLAYFVTTIANVGTWTKTRVETRSRAFNFDAVLHAGP